MAIIAINKDIFGGTGGPGHNAIPVYSDDKAPFGGQVIGPDGKQLKLVNSDESGMHYVIVDPIPLTKEENKFFSYKPDGVTPNYCRLWFRNPETGEGYDYADGVDMWVEYSHLRPYNPEPPAPMVTIDGTIIAGNISARYHVGPDGDWIKRIEG